MKVELIRDMKSEHSVPYATGTAMADVSYPTFMRWNRRYECGSISCRFQARRRSSALSSMP